MTPQEKMDAAAENYLEVAEVLSNDVNKLLDQQDETEAWRRAYIRTVAAMVVGDSYSIQQMSAIGLEFDPSILTAKEIKALGGDNDHSAPDQIKYVLRAAYKLFELDACPDFGGADWVLAQKFMDKRNRITHPKTISDLQVSESEWEDLFAGSKWLIKQHFALIARMHQKYGEGS